MIKAAIVEDNLDTGITIENFVERYSGEKKVAIKTKRYINGLDFLNDAEFDYDIVFLDIGLPLISGMDVARQIREAGSDVQIIFITSLTHYAVEGYQVNALDFIVKPVTYDLFASKLAKAIEKVNALMDKQIILSTKSGITKMDLNKVNYVEVKSHDVMFHTETDTYTVRNTMKNTEDALKDKGFARCNSCYLVNLNNVYEIKRNMLKVGKDWIPISRSKKKDFMTALTLTLAKGA